VLIVCGGVGSDVCCRVLCLLGATFCAVDLSFIRNDRSSVSIATSRTCAGSIRMLDAMDISLAKCLGETRRDAGRVCGIFEEYPYNV